MYINILQQTGAISLPNTTAQWIRSAGHPASEGENPHTEVYNQMMIKEV